LSWLFLHFVPCWGEEVVANDVFLSSNPQIRGKMWAMKLHHPASSLIVPRPGGTRGTRKRRIFLSSRPQTWPESPPKMMLLLFDGFKALLLLSDT
jgi:hypothetical protein